MGADFSNLNLKSQIKCGVSTKGKNCMIENEQTFFISRQVD